MIKIIKSIPRWIQNTDYCPLKRMGFVTMPFSGRSVSRAHCREYFALLFGFYQVSPEMRRYIREAADWAAKEKAVRLEFKNIYQAAPLAVRDAFPNDVYQTPEGRKAFIKRLLSLAVWPSPPGFGKDNADAKYHPARQIFRTKANIRRPPAKAAHVQTRNHVAA